MKTMTRAAAIVESHAVLVNEGRLPAKAELLAAVEKMDADDTYENRIELADMLDLDGIKDAYEGCQMIQEFYKDSTPVMDIRGDLDTRILQFVESRFDEETVQAVYHGADLRSGARKFR